MTTSLSSLISCFNWIGLALLLSCKPNTKPQPDSDPTVIVPGSFLSFYEQFHSDSLYQVEHVIFPLDGKPAMTDSVIPHFQWTIDDWIFQKDIQSISHEFDVNYNIVDPTIIEEYVTHKTTGYGLFRRFGLISNEWYLIYYIGMNPADRLR